MIILIRAYGIHYTSPDLLFGLIHYFVLWFIYILKNEASGATRPL